MKNHRIMFSTVLSILIILSALAFIAKPTEASDILLWEAEVSSSGEELTSILLKARVVYRVEVEGIWWYNYDENLAADAHYYTTDYSNSWYWGNNFPAPNGHSFLQINGEDVNWGPFSNGETGHKYTVYINGENAALVFKVVDWIDEDYSNNICHLQIRIYVNTTVGGYVSEFNPLQIMELGLMIALTVAMVAAISRAKHSRVFVKKMPLL